MTLGDGYRVITVACPARKGNGAPVGQGCVKDPLSVINEVTAGGGSAGAPSAVRRALCSGARAGPYTVGPMAFQRIVADYRVMAGCRESGGGAYRHVRYPSTHVGSDSELALAQLGSLAESGQLRAEHPGCTSYCTPLTPLAFGTGRQPNAIIRRAIPRSMLGVLVSVLSSEIRCLLSPASRATSMPRCSTSTHLPETLLACAVTLVRT